MPKLVSFVYTDGRRRGRNAPPADRDLVTVGAERVLKMIEAGIPIRIVAGHEFLGLTAPEPEPEPEETPEPEIETAPEGDDRDGWPDGYTFRKAGAYLAVFSPDGDAVLSDSPSGKFRGEDAAQEAAWTHREAQG